MNENQSHQGGEQEMIKVHSPLIGKVFDFTTLENILGEYGFSKNETYTYTYAAFDLPLYKSKINEDYYLRIFVDVVEGAIEKPGCKVQINEIEILKARYHQGFFYEEQVPTEHVKKSEEILRKVHEALEVPAEWELSEGNA